MCKICNGEKLDFAGFSDTVCQLKNESTNLERFVENAIEADRLRFNNGDEWGKEGVYEYVKTYIFQNSDPSLGLLLFTLCCWLDMQKKYTTVWTTDLEKTYEWITNKTSQMPSGRFPRAIKVHLIGTRNTFEQGKGFSSIPLFKAITDIALSSEQSKKGNIYRFASWACNQLYQPASKNKFISELGMGKLPVNFSGADHKRFWMWLMFLRRDQSVIRCLITRALRDYPEKQQIMSSWYDNKYFDSNECELPVDQRVFENARKLKLPGCVQFMSKQEVAGVARRIAKQHNISPSIFDAILFFDDTATLI